MVELTMKDIITLADEARHSRRLGIRAWKGVLMFRGNPSLLLDANEVLQVRNVGPGTAEEIVTWAASVFRSTVVLNAGRRTPNAGKRTPRGLHPARMFRMSRRPQVAVMGRC